MMFLRIDPFLDACTILLEIALDRRLVTGIGGRFGGQSLADGMNLELGDFSRSYFFVRVDVDVCRVVDGNQLHFVEVARFPQFFGQLQPVGPFVRRQAVAPDQKVLTL